MVVEESRILQVSIFNTLQNNLATVDFSKVLLDVITIADEVDSQLKQAILSWHSTRFLASYATTCARAVAAIHCANALSRKLRWVPGLVPKVQQSLLLSRNQKHQARKRYGNYGRLNSGDHWSPCNVVLHGRDYVGRINP
jgi:hypothetical protein